MLRVGLHLALAPKRAVNKCGEACPSTGIYRLPATRNNSLPAAGGTIEGGHAKGRLNGPAAERRVHAVTLYSD